MNGEYCVKKSQTSFTEIGIDHSGEQVIKTLKIEGGLVSIANDAPDCDFTSQRRQSRDCVK